MKFRTLFFCIIIFGCAGAQEIHKTEIHGNQVGYQPGAIKHALIFNSNAGQFTVENDHGEVVFSGRLSAEIFWEKAGQWVRIADFTKISIPGNYRLKTGDAEDFPFTVAHDLYSDLVKASTKYYYFNRASISLEAEYAGEFSRPAGHPDTVTIIHKSAATVSRPAGSRISTPRGWYDAGDYNKYIVNSGITTYTLLRAYADSQALFDTMTWNIPESTNQFPDLLDEIRWNLDWMVTMQDPEDGGVYHKNTTAGFEGFVPPYEANSTRYVIIKSTAATLDFAAVMARASQVFKEIDTEFSEKMLAQAIQAWEWSRQHPEERFTNPQDSGEFGPAVSTGAYGDRTLNDEWLWAGVELYLATGDQRYKEHADPGLIGEYRTPSWSDVATLALISLVDDPVTPADLREIASAKLSALADRLVSASMESPVHIPLDNFRWGSNSDILNQAFVLVKAYRISGDEKYMEAAGLCLDYVLGMNGPGICFVTGFGINSPINPHHRPSVTDKAKSPVPGMLIGGPNPYNMDQDCGKEVYPDHHPAMAYVDDVCSYSTNEVAINWNAPLVYVSAALQSYR